MTNKLHIDFETRSTIDLKKAGIIPYCESLNTEVLMFSYKLNDEATKIWIRNNPLPTEVCEAIQDGYLVCGHNVVFEFYVWNIIIKRMFKNTPTILFENTRCTMLKAMSYGLPASLDKLGEILNTDVKKDKTGSALMKKMCKPRKPKKNEDSNGLYYIEDEESMQKLAAYCIDDTNTEYMIDERMPDLSEDDLAYRKLDHEMQNRGIYLDTGLVSSLVSLCEKDKETINNRINELSSGEIEGVSKAIQIRKFINNRGFTLESMGKEVLESNIETVKNDPVSLELLELFKKGNKSSIAKFPAMLDTVASDKRCHNLFQYNGAFTGRWTGRLWQPQNLKRFDEDSEGDMIRDSIKILDTMSLDNAYASISSKYKSCINVASLLTRSCISAEKGLLVGADYSNIEGRMMAFISGSSSKIQKFIEQDKGGDDIYKAAVSSSLNIDIKEVNKKLRQIGKVLELSLQYGGSISALISMSKNYGVVPSQLAEPILENIRADDYDRSKFYYSQCDARMRCGLDEATFIGIHQLIKKWRNSELNLPIYNFWQDIESSFIKALQNPGVIQYIGKTKKVQYLYRDDMKVLWLRLPTGKLLAYHAPQANVELNKKSLSYMGYDSVKAKWVRTNLYGGLLSNHIIQGTSAELMKRGMLKISEKYNLIMTIHDEAVAEIDNIPLEQHEDIIKDFKNRMCDVGSEFKGLPLKSEGWIDKRYVK